MELENQVFKVLAQVLDVESSQINLSSSPDTLSDWDSLKQIQILMALEQEFGVRFNEDQMARLGSANEIITTLKAAGK